MSTKTDIGFDVNGKLTPYGLNIFDVESLYNTFVEKYPFSETRKDIFKRYAHYIEELFLSLETDSFFQYIGGSYVTNKQNPEDIDVVNCIKDCDLLKFKDDKDDTFLKKFLKRYKSEGKDLWGTSKKNYLVDAYLVILYPKTDEKLSEFTKKRLFLAQKGFAQDEDGTPKGFLKIVFNKEEVLKLKKLSNKV